MKKAFVGSIIFCIYLPAMAMAQEVALGDSVKTFKEDHSKFTVAPININTKHSEFAPVFMNGQLLFTSDHDNMIGVVYSNTKETSLTDLYVASKIDSITFKPAKVFSKTINTAYNDGPATYNKERNLLLFSTNSTYTFNFMEKGDVQKNLQLYQSEFKKNNWTTPVKLPFCKPEFSYTHPFITGDGKTLIFSSNMDGGFGGMDLYFSFFDEGIWTTPANLGSNVNSTFNEVFPYVSLNGTLYFSTNAGSEKGGLDVYALPLKETATASKQLQPMPMNSEADDFGVYVDSTGSSGYFSSNRNGANNDDIFYFTDKYPQICNCVPFVSPSYCFTFYEESAENGLSEGGDSKLIYEWNLGDGTKVKNIEARHCFKKPGTYTVELNIIEEESGALFYNEASYEFEVDDSVQLNIHCPDTIAVNTPVTIDIYKSKIPESSILNYSWSFGDGNYSSGISGTRVYKTEGTYKIQLGTEFKNDATGKVEKRCVEKTIVVAPAGWKQLESIAYTEPQKKKIIYTTENVDSLNYRVFLGSSEKQIPKNATFFDGLSDVKEYMLDSMYLYTSGKENKKIDLMGEFKKARGNGFKGARVVAYSGDSLLQSIGKLEDHKIYDWMINLDNKNTKFKDFSTNIYFTAFEDSIQVKYIPTLDLLTDILKKESDLSISIYAFADTVGSAEFSEEIFEKARLELSLKRGNAIKRVFEEKGVIVGDIKNIPRGEYPAEDAYNLNMNKLYNRRVTIYIKKKKPL